jgi:Putative prokaryotic signal transducing protein
MERLTQSVYECTLAVEGHMVCDLLASAGISARVDGEFLTGAGGELPLGNTVRVRVDPSRAAEAREVIAEWEQQQPAEAVTAPKRSRLGTPLLLLLGAIIGATIATLMLSWPHRGRHNVDYNGDGHDEVVFYFAGSRPKHTDYDRDSDGKVDARWTFDAFGFENHYESDDDFDGRFEWQSEVENGRVVRAVLDADGDGRPEQVRHSNHGVLESIDYYFASGGRILKREYYKAGLLDHAEIDADGDGVFERQVRYDAHAEPAL